MFEWKDEYLVGVTAIDQQHKQLFATAQRFHKAVAAARGKAMLDDLLTALVRYTEGHFFVEERLMSAIRYPERDQHAAQHRELRDRLIGFQQRFEGGETAMTIQVLQFLNGWLAEHTTSSDRRLGQFHRARKEPTAPPG